MIGYMDDWIVRLRPRCSAFVGYPSGQVGWMHDCMNSILNQIFVFLSKYFKLFVIIEIGKLVAGFAEIRMIGFFDGEL